MNVALLKLKLLKIECQPLWKFPRSDERGSIEAQLQRAIGSPDDQFPRSDERGSIEAFSNARRNLKRMARFHVRMNVALLKPNGGGDISARNGDGFHVRMNVALLKHLPQLGKYAHLPCFHVRMNVALLKPRG